MPKKLNPETPEEQSKRFKRDARKLIKDGHFDPAAGDAVLDRLVRKAAPKSP